jgi:hypothetical protein
MNPFTLFVRSADHSQRSAPIHGGERARVTVMNNRVALINQSCAMLCHAFVDLYVLVCDALGFG